LFSTFDDEVYLVDANTGSAQKIELPREEVERLQPNPGGFELAGGKQWMILGVPLGWQGGCYLLNLETGQVKDLKAIDKDIQEFLGGRFSWDEAYLAFRADKGMWLVPTTHPDDARELGEGSVFIADFSTDSQQIAYVQRTKAGKREIVLEDVNGSKSETVLEGDVLNVRFVPGKQQLVAAKETQLLLLDLGDRSQRELLAFQGNPIHFLFASSGGNMLFGHDANGTLVWHLLQLEKGTAQSLDDLTGYYLAVHPSSAPRWLVFVDSSGTVENHRFFGLDLETGKTREILAFDDKTRSSPPRELSTDGRFSLVTAWGQDVQQLWLLDAEKSEARLLVEAGAVRGSLAPNGRWVVVNTSERGDDGAKLNLVLMPTEGEQTMSLGKGYWPVWVYP
jgi:Tol biopolymer transport system component